MTLERVYSLGAEDDTPVARRFEFTSTQEEAIRTALELGYFAIPREATASEVADARGIAKSAFLKRLRSGQASLFG